MDKKPKSKKIYVTSYTLKSANSKVVSEKTYGKGFVVRHSASGKFVTRDELKDAFKTASRKLKSA
jgi:hypothetical protein